MIHDLRPYPRMKDSGVPWLGQVPEHWNVIKIKRLFREREERVGGNEVQLLSLTRAKGLIPQAAASSRIASVEDLSKYKMARPGNLVMNRMQAWSGMFSASDLIGAVSPDYSVFEMLHEGEVVFFEHLFKVPSIVDQFAQASKGIGTGFNRLYTPAFGSVDVTSPPPAEQAAIVRFLAHADHRIRKAIAAKQRLIRLLQEQKQVIIHQAVTRGLDADVQLKPSGVEWLGDVPVGWEVLPLRRRWSVTDCKHLTVPFAEEGYLVASVREAQHFDIDFKEAKRTSREFYQLLIDGGRLPKRGDLIYCRNVGVGSAAYVSTDEPFAMGQDVCLIRSNSENQRYLNYFLKSPFMRIQLQLLLVGSTFPRINVADVKSLLVVVPPLKEQAAIAEFLDQSFLDISSTEEKIYQEISLLREYRTRLIADVVTGKLDVREAASLLPELEQDSVPEEQDGEEAEGLEGEGTEAEVGEE